MHKNNVSDNQSMVESLYYGQVEGKLHTFTQLDHLPPMMIDSHLLRAIRFPMMASLELPKKFNLSSEVYENIYNSMPLDDDAEENVGMTTLPHSTILLNDICTSGK